MKKISALLVLSFYIGAIAAQSADVEFFHYRVEQGLSQTNIYSIVQDKYGFIWIGSQEGLVCYDGAVFTEYLANPELSGSISNSSISSILCDSKNNIWAGTWGGGLNLLQRGSGTFVVFKKESGNINSISHNRVQCLFEDKDGFIWAGTAGGGLNRLDPASKKFYAYQHDSTNSGSIISNRIWTIIQDKKGRIWIGTQFGISVLDPKSGKISNHLISNSPASSRANVIRALYTDVIGRVWAGTEDGIYILNDDVSVAKHIYLNTNGKTDLSSLNVNCFAELPDHSMLIGTNGAGLYHYFPESGSISAFINNPAEHQSLSENDIRCLLVDKSGLIWIGTRYGGINTTELKQRRFITITDDPLEPFKLSGKNIRSVLAGPDGKIWVGTNNNGLNLVQLKPASTEVLSVEKIPDKGKFNRILTFCSDIRGTVWFATERGINYIPKGRKDFTECDLSNDLKYYIGYFGVRSLAAPAEGELLVGTNGAGLIDYNLKTKQLKVYDANLKGFGGSEVYSILPDSGNTYWLATNNGLTLFNRASGSFITFGTGNASPSLHGVQSLFLCPGTDNQIWIGTTNGLYAFDKHQKSLKKYTKINGLQTDIINSICTDASGALWLGTPKGLTWFQPSSEQCKNYDNRDGLSWNQFNPASCAKTAEGILLIGGVNGLLLLNPGKIGHNNFQPPAYISKVAVYEKAGTRILVTPTAPVLKNGEIVLSPYQNFINIYFSVLNYRYSGKNMVRYKLDGVDVDWRYARPDEYAHYTDLDPGKYTFRMQACNNDGIWTSEGAYMLIIIEPPFYSTWWFKLITIMIILGALLSFYFIRITNLKRRKAQLETIVRERTSQLEKSEAELKQINSTKDKLFSIIAHDLRSPFQALMSYSDIIYSDYDQLLDSEKKAFAKQISDVSQGAYGLLNNLLQWSNNQSNRLQINPVVLDLEKTLRPIITLSMQAAEIKNISISVDLQPTICIYCDPDTISTVFRNLLSNAVKFTPDNGRIKIIARQVDKNIEIVFSDTGVGIAPETVNALFSLDKKSTTVGTRGEKGSGLGLVLCREFVDKNGGSISVNSRKGEGTDFKVVLPSAY